MHLTPSHATIRRSIAKRAIASALPVVLTGCPALLSDWAVSGSGTGDASADVSLNPDAAGGTGSVSGGGTGGAPGTGGRAIGGVPATGGAHRRAAPLSRREVRTVQAERRARRAPRQEAHRWTLEARRTRAEARTAVHPVHRKAGLPARARRTRRSAAVSACVLPRATVARLRVARRARLRLLRAESRRVTTDSAISTASRVS